jgi:ABC-type transport system substrate-binding protein
MKKINIVVLVTLLIGISTAVYLSHKENSNMKLRVAFPYDKPVDAYEPTKIHLAPEYIFLENIYSPLIELSKDNGTPVAGLAESFKWIDGELHLKIRKTAKTIDGKSITAKDVEFSLKRLLVLSENTHGNFKDLICPNEALENIESNCSGISVEDNTVILKPNGEKAFLVPMIAAIDFAIIPKSSVDPVSLKIIDYRNTSGPYYVESDNGDGNIVLKANSTHYNYSNKIPQEIVLVPSSVGNHKDSITLFKENKVDFITTIDKLNPEKIISYAENSGHSLHSTMNIRTFLLTFTSKGLKKYSVEQRLAIGKKIKRSFHKNYENISGYEKSNQFFPALGDGSLDENESKLIDKLYKETKDVEINNLKLSIVRLGDIKQYTKMLNNEFPNLDLIDGKNAPAFLKYKSEDEMPDCFISGPDTGFMEDIGLISYSMYAGFFGMNRADGNKWLAGYMNILEKKERLLKLKDLHIKSLKEAIIVPLVSAPYVALARKSWKIELSQIYANNPLWPIVKK